MMGVYFNNKHSFNDFKLVLKSKDIPLPEPKTHYIEVPCADGQLDLSTALTGGEIKYKTRTITLVFTTMKRFKEWESVKSNLASFIHGKVMNVKFDVDSTHYFKGRCVIESFEESKGTMDITVKIDAEPYKYNVTEFNQVVSVAGTKVITIPDQKMRVVPKINVSAEMQLEYKTKTHKLFAGDNVITDVYLGSGQDNVLKFIGNGTVTIKFIGGEL